MVIRDSRYPRLAREYHGEIVYATPGSGKTYISNKYRDVVDGDDLMVEAICELSQDFCVPPYDDPREVIFRYFRFIRFNHRKKQTVYKRCMEKMEAHCRENDVVFCGSVDLIPLCDRLFIEEDEDNIRNGFLESKVSSKETKYSRKAHVPVHYIDCYLEKAMQKTAEAIRNNYYY